MQPRIWDGDPFTNVAKVNVIPLRAALAACATCGTDSGDAAELAPTPASLVHGCVNRKWRDRYGDYGLDACAVCIAAKAVHFPHKERCSCAGEYLGRVHIDIARPMQVKSTGGKEHEHIAVDDYTRAVYTQPLRLKSEAPEP